MGQTSKRRAPASPRVTPWRDYLARAPRHRYGDCRRLYGPAFARQKQLIGRLADRLRPEVVACLGAGVLNDIPYAALVRSGAAIHLVDWLPGAVEAGVGLSIMEVGEGGRPQCAYCAIGGEAAAYCRGYRGGSAPRQGVCDNFKPAGDRALACAAFDLGERPAIHAGDVTQGFASACGTAMGEALSGAGTWRQALRAAAAAAKRTRRHRHSLAIADGSVDLVTSSMLISQFDAEPYGYFSHQAAARFGLPDESEERRLRGESRRLRSLLLATQIERHCDEIERILAPGGRCFMSFEMFHFDAGSGRWFLVEEMHRALAYLAGRFDFDFDAVPASDNVGRFQGQGAVSLVHSFVLAPKGAVGNTDAKKAAGPWKVRPR